MVGGQPPVNDRRVGRKHNTVKQAGSGLEGWMLRKFQGEPLKPDHVLAFCQASFCMTLSRAGFLTLVPSTFPPPGGHPHPGIKPESPVSPALAGRFLTAEPPGKSNSLWGWVGVGGWRYKCFKEDQGLKKKKKKEEDSVGNIAQPVSKGHRTSEARLLSCVSTAEK